MPKCSPETQEMRALQREVQHCAEQVELLRREFSNLKHEVESTWKTMDVTRSIISEYVLKMIVDNNKQ